MMHFFSIAYYAFERIRVGGRPWIVYTERLVASPPILTLYTIFFSLLPILPLSKSLLIGFTLIMIFQWFILFYFYFYFEKKNKDVAFVIKYRNLGKKYAKVVYWVYSVCFLSFFILPILSFLIFKRLLN